MSTVATYLPRVGRKVAEGFASYGVATVLEAQGRTGVFASWPTSAVTVCALLPT